MKGGEGRGGVGLGVLKVQSGFFFLGGGEGLGVLGKKNLGDFKLLLCSQCCLGE